MPSEGTPVLSLPHTGCPFGSYWMPKFGFILDAHIWTSEQIPNTPSIQRLPPVQLILPGVPSLSGPERRISLPPMTRTEPGWCGALSSRQTGDIIKDLIIRYQIIKGQIIKDQIIGDQIIGDGLLVPSGLKGVGWVQVRANQSVCVPRCPIGSCSPHTCISSPADRPRALASSAVSPFFRVLLTETTGEGRETGGWEGDRQGSSMDHGKSSK